MDRQRKWDLRWLAVADLFSTFSKDPSTKVGATIVDCDNRLLSMGYNGPPPGVDDDYAVLGEREIKIKCVIHAEANAITHSNIANLMGSTMYCTHLPCPNCAALMISKGIGRLVTWKTDIQMAKRWSWDVSEKMLADVGLFVEMYDRQV